MTKILVIDDEAPIRNALRDILEYEKYEVEEASEGHTAISMVEKEHFDVILCDIKMPQIDGMEVLEKLLKITDSPIIMISGHGTIETAMDAIHIGAYDFIPKPLDLNRLLVSLRNALDRTNLVNETKVLKKKVNKQYEMIGESESIKEIKDMIERVAPTDARVLITGASGTGKELVARWLHEKSNRADEPFVEVNCAAIPSELIESVLFGHEKGAFTSAVKQRKGDFEQAHKGTIFLDEIGDMSLSAQAKVLRALQENKITRVGGEKEIPVDVRVIAATNKNLLKEVEENRFREDLYHRISVILIHVPTLNEREDDIPLLVAHFLETIAESQGRNVPKITDEAVEALQKIHYNGNIRELRNIVERLSIMAGNTITLQDVEKYAQPFRQ